MRRESGEEPVREGVRGMQGDSVREEGGGVVVRDASTIGTI